MFRKIGIVSAAKALVIAGLLGCFLIPASAPQPALAATFGWAYVWAGDPTSSPPTLNPLYQYNSTGVKNTMTRTGTGAYTVSLPGLGASAGVVHVTAYGSGNGTCKVASWNPSGTTQNINVRCFSQTGAPQDSQFTLTFTNPGSLADGPMAYLWANKPTLTTEYFPDGLYQFNSTGAGAINKVVRNGTGDYTAKLPGVGANDGHVQVTAYGSTGSERCKVGGWGPSGTTEFAYVKCFNSSGAPVDSMFTLTYVNHTNILGASACSPFPGIASVYVWANYASKPSYTVIVGSQWYYRYVCTTLPTADTNITRTATGAYSIKPVGFGLSTGDVQVTAYGSGPEYCRVLSWYLAVGIQVQCFNASGAPVDTQFDVTYMSH